MCHSKAWACAACLQSFNHSAAWRLNNAMVMSLSCCKQAAVVQLLSQHYVSLLLDGSIPSKDLYCRLWLTLTAHATLLLLRCGCGGTHTTHAPCWTAEHWAPRPTPSHITCCQYMDCWLS
jgi:hypothetical protein